MQMTVAISSHSRKKLKTYVKNNDRQAYRHWRQRTKESKIYLCTLFAISEGKCPECGVDMYLDFKNTMYENKATLDHVEPLSVTMEHDKLNLQIMCWKCNREKGNKIED